MGRLYGTCPERNVSPLIKDITTWRGGGGYQAQPIPAFPHRIIFKRLLLRHGGSLEIAAPNEGSISSPDKHLTYYAVEASVPFIFRCFYGVVLMFRFHRLFWLAALSSSISAGALATEYHPGFTCPRPNNDDQLAVEICANQSMAREELIFEKTYYAHRQQDGVQAYHDLKVKAVAYNTALRTTCGIPAAGSSGQMPPTAPACYVDQIKSQVANLSTTLHGGALDEARRDIDVHIEIQQKLMDTGLLPGTSADGIYGDATRIAIVRWQQQHGYSATGFVTDTQASVLLDIGKSVAPFAAAAPAPEPNPAPTDNAPFLSSERGSVQPAVSTFAEQPTVSGSVDGANESDFTSIISIYHQKFAGAGNEFLQGRVFRERNAALQEAFKNGLTVKNWTGAVYKLSSNGGGKGILEVTLSNDAWVETMNNALSDMEDHTLVEPGSALYDALGSLKEGDKVVFSGSFFLDRGGDNVLETTDMTMNGKMTEPEFVFQFTSISKQ